MIPLKNYFKCGLLLLAGFFLTQSTYAQGKPEWVEFEEAVSIADSSRKPILIDIWAPWCGWCRKMKKEVYPKYAGKLNEQFILTRLNRDDNNSAVSYKSRKYSEMRLARHFKTETVPAVVILTPDGEYLLHVTGFIDGKDFEQLLDYALTRAAENDRAKGG